MQFSDIEIHIISEYICDKCQDFLIVAGVDKKFPYLYTLYTDSDNIEFTKVRYLRTKHTHNLSLYTNLIVLIFTHNFNDSLLENWCPNTITCIIFGINFNQPLQKNIFPDSVISIAFGQNFNQKIEKDVLPKYLKYLSFNCNRPLKTHPAYVYARPLQETSLPNTLKAINISKSYHYIVGLEEICKRRNIFLYQH